MKVKLEKDYKKYYTIEELERAKRVINYEKEDDCKIEDWAEYAIREALKNQNDYLEYVVKATAETGKNSRIYDAYGDDTGMMDVIIRATGRTTKGYIEVTACLSDIWNSGAVDYREHMYIRKFVEEK